MISWKYSNCPKGLVITKKIWSLELEQIKIRIIEKSFGFVYWKISMENWWRIIIKIALLQTGHTIQTWKVADLLIIILSSRKIIPIGDIPLIRIPPLAPLMNICNRTTSYNNPKFFFCWCIVRDAPNNIVIESSRNPNNASLIIIWDAPNRAIDCRLLYSVNAASYIPLFNITIFNITGILCLSD